MSSVKYVYLDESGDLGKFGSKFFTVAAIVVDDPKILTRIIKKLRQRKLKKSIKELIEIKANNSDEMIRRYVLSRVSAANCSIFAIVVKKDSVANYLFDAKNKLYNYLCGLLLRQLGVAAGKLVIVVDKKYTNTLLRQDFDGYIRNKLQSGKAGLEVEIFHKPSYSSNELQVVDFVTWGISRKFNTGDDAYYKLIELKIANKEELVLWQ